MNAAITAVTNVLKKYRAPKDKALPRQAKDDNDRLAVGSGGLKTP